MGGSIVQQLANLLPDPATSGLIPSIPKTISEEKIVNIAEVNQHRCLEESGQWLENADLELASGKPVPQKRATL